MRAHVLKLIDHWTVECILYLPLNIQAVRPVRLYGLRPVNISACRDSLVALIGRDDVTVSVREDKTGKYGQILGTLFCDGKNVNQSLIKDNHAKVFTPRKIEEY